MNSDAAEATEVEDIEVAVAEQEDVDEDERPTAPAVADAPPERTEAGSVNAAAKGTAAATDQNCRILIFALLSARIMKAEHIFIQRKLESAD